MKNLPDIESEAVPLPVQLPALRSYFGGERPDCSIGLIVDGLDDEIRLDSRSRPMLLVGRSSECDLSLPDPDVSHRHASLQLVRGGVYCVDLLSRSGTFWRGRRRSSGWVHPGESLTIGPYRITYPKSANTAEAGGLVPAELAKTNLLRTVEPFDIEFAFLNGRGLAENRWKMNAPMVLIGKGKRCRLNINHSTVSRVHCSLMATPAGVWITDLLGKGGTWVNEEKVSQQLLKAGDEVRVGKFRFQVNFGGSSNAVSSDGYRHLDQPTRDADAVGPSASGGLSENVVLSMMDRFSEMQQQMFAMSHQQMMMMTQLVGNMHNSYSDLAQKELARIHDIGDQIDTIQLQLASSESPAAETAQRAVPGPSAIEQPAPASQQEPLDHVEVGDEQPDEPPAEIAGEQTAVDPQRRQYSQGDVESHAMLIERMSVLERERSSRWKKLMGMITGSSR